MLPVTVCRRVRPTTIISAMTATTLTSGVAHDEFVATVFLLQSLVEQHAWARERVKAGIDGMRAHRTS